MALRRFLVAQKAIKRLLLRRRLSSAPLDARKCSFSDRRRRQPAVAVAKAATGWVALFPCNWPGGATLNQSKADIG